jgi:hypothetical protein
LQFDSKGDYTGKTFPDKTGKYFGRVIADGTGKVLWFFQFQAPRDALSIMSSRNPDGTLSEKPTGNEDGFRLVGLDLTFENTMDNTITNNIALVGRLTQATNDLIMKLRLTLDFVAQESLPHGKMDYASHFGGRLNDRVAVIGNRAYNNFDTGNYMWGRTMAGLGFSPWQARMGAQLYERWCKQHWDNDLDQMAIEQGARSYTK